MKNKFGKLPSRVALLYADVRREYYPTEQLYIADVEVEDRVKEIQDYFKKMKIKTACFPGDKNIVKNLQTFRPDLVFNLVDSVYGQEFLCTTIPATLELLSLPYTGTGITGLDVNCNRALTKTILWQNGITTPKFQLVKHWSDEIDYNLDFPLITKLNDAHGSIEMGRDAICDNEKELKKRLRYLISTYKMPVVVEEYIAGREVAVFTLEGGNTKLYSAEKVFLNGTDPKYRIASFDAVWGEEETYVHQKYVLPPRVKEQLKWALEVLHLGDYVKFDLRVDESGRHYIIDCNANPCLGPVGYRSIGDVLELYDISFEEILRRLMHNSSRSKSSPITFKQ